MMQAGEGALRPKCFLLLHQILSTKVIGLIYVVKVCQGLKKKALFSRPRMSCAVDRPKLDIATLSACAAQCKLACLSQLVNSCRLKSYRFT